MRTFGLHRPHLFIFFLPLHFSFSPHSSPPLALGISSVTNLRKALFSWWSDALSNNQPSGIAQDLSDGALGPQGCLTRGLASIPSAFKGIPSLFLLPQPFPSQEYSCSSRPHRAALVISIPLLCTLPTRSNPPTLFPSHLLIFCNPFLQASLALFGRDSFPKQCLSYQECLEDFI